MVFQGLADLSIANSALFPRASVGEGPGHEVEGPLHPNPQAHILQYQDFWIFSPDFGSFIFQFLQPNNCLCLCEGPEN